MSENFPHSSDGKMEADTPLTKTNQGPTKGSRHRIPPVAYDENDVVMRDIQERMREKRQKRADLNRSRRAKITNASTLLKLSLRANNRALAKALEEAHCESRQDKSTIFELQCALEEAQQEIRQNYQTIQDLKLEGKSLMELVTHFQESEAKQRRRIYEVKKLLNEVTGKYLMKTVTLIDQAAGICNTPSLSKGSSFFVPKASLSEDNFRDTLSAPIQDADSISRANIYYKPGCPSNFRDQTSEVSDDREETKTDSNDVDNPSSSGDFDCESTSPSRLSVCGEEFQRQRSMVSSRRSRATSFLDVNEMRLAVSKDVMNSCEEEEETNSAPPSPGQLSPAKEREEDNVERDISPEELKGGPLGEGSSPAVSKENFDLNGEVCLEKTDLKEKEMELTDMDKENSPTDEEAATDKGTATDKEAATDKGPQEDVDAAVNMEQCQAQQPSKDKKTKKLGIKKKISKGGKVMKKVPKTLPCPKATKGKKKTLQECSVFDLSQGESFTHPMSPHQVKKCKTFEQNLSTESEKSEPGEGSSSLADGKSAEFDKGESAGNSQEGVYTSQPCEEVEHLDQPKVRRRSRQTHSKSLGKETSLELPGPDSIIDEGLVSTVICSPFTGNEEVTHKELKPLSQVLKESSHNLENDVEGSFTALSRKPNFHKNMSRLKQRKKLYDPKKSLDKEFTHTILTSQNTEENRTDFEKGRQRKRSSVKRTQLSVADLGDADKGIANESLSGLLEECWMKDFLNDIDGENQDERAMKSKSRGRQSRKTFRVSFKEASKAKGAAEPDETNSQHVPGEIDVDKERGSKRINRRGTVCLKKKKKSENLPEIDEMEGRTVEDGACVEEKDKRGAGEAISRAMMQTAREHLTDIENRNSSKMSKELRVIRRGTFDVKSVDKEDSKNTVDERIKKTERLEDEVPRDNGNKRDKKQVKRKSDEISKDGKENSEQSRKRSNKRIKTMEGFVDETPEEDRVDFKGVEVTKKSSEASPVSSARSRGKKTKRKEKSDRKDKKSLTEKLNSVEVESSELHKENLKLVEEHDVVDEESTRNEEDSDKKNEMDDLISGEVDHRDETKTQEMKEMRNAKEVDTAPKQCLQSSVDKGNSTSQGTADVKEEVDLCTVDESGDKPFVVEDPPLDGEIAMETGRRPSRQARTKAAKNLKEPSLGKKLRRGDPFTDVKLLTSPLVKCKKGKKKVTNKDVTLRTALGNATNLV